ncbi:N-acetyltransferase [Tatumella sp. TA1]|uniref:GNAT family N-acetyltransferase n=1 Tax=Rosenbergiella collisarenosi TaxID=1544695 RepID=UPI0008F83DA7|nr:N-acetyltransferase [Rosenbergiella collisarenosi]MBT0719810.1 N-acetyltransferase [Rosenbergiella collisarenosi]QGX90446.1 N-acetyltransferase [Tatumella sp. TA1]
MLLRTEIGLDAAGIDALTRHGIDRPQLAERIRALREDGLITLGVVATDEEGKILGYIAFSPILVNGEEQHWVVISAMAIDPLYASTSVAKDLLFEGLDSLNEFSYRAAVGYQEIDWLDKQGFQHAQGLTLDAPASQAVVVYPLEEQGAAQLSAVLTLPRTELTEPTTH